MGIKYNPFSDAGITNYEQYKLYPFLVLGTLDRIKNRITQQIIQIKDKYYFGERLIILGERGIGKTSTLFFIKDMLKESNITTCLFSRLVEDAEHFKVITGGSVSDVSASPCYILIDFPDTLDNKNYKRFLEFLWSLMTHKNYNKINLIFSMNKSHFEKSFSFSEIFGKFITLRLEKLDLTQSESIIESRLKIIDKELEEVFDAEVLEIIFNYSKGIPRNIISACSLLIDNSNGKSINKDLAKSVLKEKYIDQVINDRVNDLELKRIFKQMVSILENEFKGTSNSQEDYVKRVMDLTGIGRNSALMRVNDLTKFGIFSQYKGGYNRVNKIISIN